MMRLNNMRKILTYAQPIILILSFEFVFFNK